MKTLHPVIIVVLIFSALFVASPAYATCAIGPNGAQVCVGAPPALDQIKSDKLNYEILEKPVITITGVPQTLAHLEVDDSSGNIKFTHDINLSSNGSASYTLDVSTYKPGIYNITATSLMSKITTNFAVGLDPTGGRRIMVNIAKNSYFPGDPVAIFGAYNPHSIIQLSLTDPHGVVVKSVQTVADETGHFSSSDIQIPFNAIPGIWMTGATSGVFHTNMEINVISSITVGPTNMVDISNIRIQPSTIKVGDKFAITATLVNNSPNSISIGISPCGEPFPIYFDNHTIIEQEENVPCADYILEERIDPGKNTTQTSPSAPITTEKPMVNAPQTIFFKAVKAGIENATISFAYNIMNQADSNQSQIQKVSSKSFLFMIYDNKTDFSNGLYTNQSVTNTIDTPLKQFKSGVTTQNITCKEGFVLAIKKQGHQPACVNPDTIPKLVLRGWSENPLNELLLRYGNQTQANLVFYDIMNEPKVRDWSMKGWRYSDYSYASNGDTQQSSATVHLYLPPNTGKHLECENGSYAIVVMNLKPVKIEYNYTKVGCEIDTTTGASVDPELNRK